MKVFPTNVRKFLGASHSFYWNERPINSTDAVWYVSNLMKIRFDGSHFTHPFRKVYVVYGCIDSIANWSGQKYTNLKKIKHLCIINDTVSAKLLQNKFPWALYISQFNNNCVKLLKWVISKFLNKRNTLVHLLIPINKKYL